MKRIVLTLAVFTAVFGLNAFGQVVTPQTGISPVINAVTDLPMLRSKDALRTYALEQSANVRAQISTSLSVGNNAYGFVPVEEATASGIADAIRGMNLSVDVANPNDPLFVWAGAYNADGDPLFTGDNRFSLVNGFSSVTGEGGYYALPPDYGNVTLTLYDNIPIKVDGAQSAIIYILGRNGKTQMQYSLNVVRNSKVYFPWRLAGTNAILAVCVGIEVKPGQIQYGWEYWNVNSGSKFSPEHFNVTLKPTIQGIASFTDADVFVAVPTTNGIGYNLTAELKVTGQRWNNVAFWTTEGKSFNGAWVRKSGASQWQYYRAFPQGQDTGAMIFGMSLSAGVYYIVPVWNDGDLIEPPDPYYPPYDGGGEGQG